MPPLPQRPLTPAELAPVLAARKEWQNAKTALESSSDPQAKKALLAALMREARLLNKAVIASRDAHARAVEEDIKAFHLRPPQDDFSGDTRLSDRSRAMLKWNPRFSTEEIRDPVLGRKIPRTLDQLKQERAENLKRATALGVPSRDITAAETDQRTGEIVLYAEAFQSPEKLATMIYHETSHWLDAVKEGGRVSEYAVPRFATEKRAFHYQAEFLKALNRVTDGENAELVSKRYEKQEAEAPRELLLRELVLPEYQNWLRGSMPQAVIPGATLERPEPLRAGADDGFYASLAELRGVAEDSRRVARGISDKRESAEKERARVDQEKLLRALDEERENIRYLRTMAGLACSDPGALDAEAAKSSVIPARLSPWLDSYSLSDTAGPGSLNSCQIYVLDRLDARRRRYEPVSTEDLAQWARRYRDENPSLLRRFTTSLGEFFEALAQAKSAPRPSRDEPSRREPAERRQESAGCATNPRTGIVGCPVIAND